VEGNRRPRRRPRRAAWSCSAHTAATG